mmetsp:Transcript_19687/g.47184  ORF Transcript_19687/g.47184 Transcript_19687/m.47184 type:complete len:104 (-) Transcript_19687:236-547(-)
MLSRWARLGAIFAGSKTYSLEPRDPPTPDVFASITSGYAASPAYAWIKKLDGGDALAAMAAAGIRGRGGPMFGVASSFVRLELLMREETFELLAEKLEALVRS